MMWLTPRPGTACTGGMIWCPEAASRPSDELRSVTGVMPGLLWSPNSPGANSPLSPCPRFSRGRMNMPVRQASAVSLAQMIDEAAPQSGGVSDSAGGEEGPSGGAEDSLWQEAGCLVAVGEVATRGDQIGCRRAGPKHSDRPLKERAVGCSGGIGRRGTEASR